MKLLLFSSHSCWVCLGLLPLAYVLKQALGYSYMPPLRPPLFMPSWPFTKIHISEFFSSLIPYIHLKSQISDNLVKFQFQDPKFWQKIVKMPKLVVAYMYFILYTPIFCLEGVLHPWSLFLKILCIFSKNKVTLTKYPIGLIRNVPRNSKISFISIETMVVKLL